MLKKTKPKKDIIWALFIIIIFSVLFYIAPQNTGVCFRDACFKVETVEGEKDISIGLMYREKLDADEGMLFLFPDEDRHSFWMRNTLIPLDIIWLDKDKKVVFLKEGAEPCKEEICETFKPDKNALYVLEINKGAVKEKGLQVGDAVQFDFK